MILRRVMQHVKRQDWFAVMLDFVIVVLGVFVATQVSNWNEAGAERRRERAYLQRIHDDVASLRASTAEADHTAKEVSGLLNEAMGALASGEDARIANLGAHYCTAIVRSHIFATPIVTPPAIEEVLQSGEVGIIVDQELRTAIVRYYQEIEDMSQLRSDLQIDRRALGRTYPNLIKVGLVRWEDSACQFSELARDQAFLNDFADALRRYSAFAIAILGRLNIIQSDLHSMLDERLGIRHEVGAAK